MKPDIQTQIDRLRQDLEALNAEYYANNFTESQDFNKYSRFNTKLKVPVFATAPTTCEPGQVYFNTSTSKFYVCTAANTWTAQT